MWGHLLLVGTVTALPPLWENVVFQKNSEIHRLSHRYKTKNSWKLVWLGKSRRPLWVAAVHCPCPGYLFGHPPMTLAGGPCWLSSVQGVASFNDASLLVWSFPLNSPTQAAYLFGSLRQDPASLASGVGGRSPRGSRPSNSFCWPGFTFFLLARPWKTLAVHLDAALFPLLPRHSSVFRLQVLISIGPFGAGSRTASGACQLDGHYLDCEVEQRCVHRTPTLQNQIISAAHKTRSAI